MTDTHTSPGNADSYSSKKNTDLHLWPFVSEEKNAPRLFVTAGDGIGIDVGGHIIVKPLREWHALAGATAQTSRIAITSERSVELERLIAESPPGYIVSAQLPASPDNAVTDEMMTAAMRAFERMSAVLRYREKDKWHTCDIVGMRDAIKAAISVAPNRRSAQETLEKLPCEMCVGSKWKDACPECDGAGYYTPDTALPSTPSAPGGSARAAFDGIIASLGYDGSDDNSLTVGEIRRALP